MGEQVVKPKAEMALKEKENTKHQIIVDFASKATCRARQMRI